MNKQIKATVGYIEIVKGKKVYHSGECNNSNYYKDDKSFSSKKGVCYIPESDFNEDGLADSGYTFKDFLDLAKGDKELAEYLYESIEWQLPEVYLDQCIDIDEVYFCPECKKYSMIRGKIPEKCPKCKKPTV